MNMNKNDFIERHVFSFNPTDKGGEQFMLVTDFFWNGDAPTLPCMYTNQKLTLNSYYNQATIELVGTAITPENLRELANQLEQSMNEAFSKILNRYEEKKNLQGSV